MKIKHKRLILAVLLAAMALSCRHAEGGAPNSNEETAKPVNPYANIGPRVNNADDPADGIYVSPKGNNAAADGSIDAPYKSINTALEHAEPGCTIILRGGRYRERENVRVRQPNITIKSAKGEWAVIDLTTYNSGHNEDSGVYFDVDSSGCTLQYVEVVGGFYAVCLETTWEWGIEYYPTQYGASDITIEDCVLHHSKNDVVKIKPNCNNITIRYNEIHHSGQAYINNPDFTTGERNSEGIDNVNGDNMTVQNNYIHDICSTGVYAKGGATNALIENNRIERAYGAGVMVGFDTSPQYFHTFYDPGINPEWYENIGGIVRNNLIIHTGWEGIGFYASKDGQVYNNTLADVNYAQNYHSAVYFGIATQDEDPDSGRPATVNPNFHHNIVSQPAAFTRRPMIEIRYIERLNDTLPVSLSALSGMPTMNNNCYFIAGKSAAFNDMRPGSALSNAGFSAWQSNISGDADSIEADPVLNADYMPTNPLCAGIGVTVSLN